MKSSQSVADNNNLPPGWYMKVDNYGRSFYIDSQSGKSYWRKPVEVKGGLVIKSEDERRAFFKGIYTELTKRHRQLHGTSRVLPSYLELYKIANKEHVNENKFGHFLRKYTSKSNQNNTHLSSSNEYYSPNSLSAQSRNRQRVRNAQLANKASKEAKEYAMKKKRQKDLANQKRFGNTWSKSPKSADSTSRKNCKLRHRSGSSKHSSPSFRSPLFSSLSKQISFSNTFTDSRGSNQSRRNAGGLSQNTNIRTNQKMSGQLATPQFKSTTMSINSYETESRSSISTPSSFRDSTTNQQKSLLKVVLNRTEAEKQRTSALRRAINSSKNGDRHIGSTILDGSINNEDRKLNDVELQKNKCSVELQEGNIDALENSELSIHRNLNEEKSKSGEISTPSKTRPLSTEHVTSSALTESSLDAWMIHKPQSHPHNNSIIQKQLKITYDSLQQLIAAEHATSSISIPEVSKLRLVNAKRIIEAKVDEEFSRLYQVLAKFMSSRGGVYESHKYSVALKDKNEKELSKSVSMASKLERDSLQRENTALKERLHNAVTIQENLRDSEANLKRQLLSLRGKLSIYTYKLIHRYYIVAKLTMICFLFLGLCIKLTWHG
jgi:hypothetical protein